MSLGPLGVWNGVFFIFIQAYIGNLTWWTTDADISDSVASIGVTDFIEVKFYENRINGQSKGFCSVYVGSETSLRLLMDQMPKKELHGQKPEVTYATKVRQSRAILFLLGHTYLPFHSVFI